MSLPKPFILRKYWIISDFGCSISDCLMRNIFTPVLRLAGSKNRHFPGISTFTGSNLGLFSGVIGFTGSNLDHLSGVWRFTGSNIFMH
jgi:hypothetical protein